MDIASILEPVFGTFDPLTLLQLGLSSEGLILGFKVGVLCIIVQELIAIPLVFGTGPFPKRGIRMLKPTRFNYIVVGPFIEELIYRLGVISAVFTFTGSLPLAVVISILAFAVVHIPYYGFYWGFLAKLATGTILAYVFLTYGLSVAVVAHMTNNLIAGL